MSTLEALQAQIRACRRCRYSHPVTPVVAGTAAARVMLVGQAPGKTDDGSGLPWAGPAGKRLMRWMIEIVGFASVEAVRRQVYMSAVTRCFPGPSPKGKGDRRPAPAEIEACAPYLAHELALVRPAVIVPVGGLAIERFLGKVKLESVVGRAAPMRFADFTALVVPLPHPSGASTWLNDSQNQALLRQGLMRLRAAILAEDLAVLAS